MAIRDLFSALTSIFSREEPTPLEKAITEANEIMEQARNETSVPADETRPQIPVIDARLNEQGRTETSTANFAGLIQMFNSGAGDLVAALEQASQERNSRNLYAVAFEIFRVIKPYQIDFISGGEDLWLDSVRKMKSLAEEAAAMDDAVPEACNLAGIIAGTTWGFQDFSLSSTQIAEDGSVESKDVTDCIKKENIVAADIDQALKWFEKGAALGDEVCADNARKARALLLPPLPETPPQAPTPPGP